jgi:hypothetical protein
MWQTKYASAVTKNLGVNAKLHTCRLAVNIAQIIYSQRLFVILLLALGQH